MRTLPVRMPKFSMAQEDAILLAWKKSPGDRISAGEVMCEVATDKVDMDVEAPFDGTIVELLAAEQQTVPVGEPIALVQTEADEFLDDLFVAPRPAAESASVKSAASTPAAAATTAGPVEIGAEATRPTAPSRKSGRPALPGARRRAAALGVKLEAVIGSGRAGVITVADVEAAAASRAGATSVPPSSPQTVATPVRPLGEEGSRSPAPSGAVEPNYAVDLAPRRRAVRAAIARVMSEAASIPQFTVYGDLDLEPLARERGRIGWTTWLMWFMAATVRQFPELNARWAGDHAEESDRVGVSLAVDTPIGLLAPVIFDPDLRSLEGVDAQVRSLVDRARMGKLQSQDLEGGTITLSNLGGFGVAAFQAVVTPPQVSAVSLGAVAPTPVVLGSGLTVRTTCRVGVTVDHRAADGAQAARFVAQLNASLSDPTRALRQAG